MCECKTLFIVIENLNSLWNCIDLVHWPSRKVSFSEQQKMHVSDISLMQVPNIGNSIRQLKASYHAMTSCPFGKQNLGIICQICQIQYCKSHYYENIQTEVWHFCYKLRRDTTVAATRNLLNVIPQLCVFSLDRSNAYYCLHRTTCGTRTLFY